VPQNRVEFFVSYYDYYQPEAYVPRTDTFIEKDSSVNEEIDRLRHAADVLAPHAPRHDRRGLGVVYLRTRSPLEYRERMLQLEVGDTVRPARAAAAIGEMQYNATNWCWIAAPSGMKGDTLEIQPAYSTKRFASRSSRTSSKRSRSSTR